jgi:hypothetical protein
MVWSINRIHAVTSMYGSVRRAVDGDQVPCQLMTPISLRSLAHLLGDWRGDLILERWLWKLGAFIVWRAHPIEFAKSNHFTYSNALNRISYLYLDGWDIKRSAGLKWNPIQRAFLHAIPSPSYYESREPSRSFCQMGMQSLWKSQYFNWKHLLRFVLMLLFKCRCFK